jgi:tetratricopeptide (TPR) repeat protein
MSNRDSSSSSDFAKSSSDKSAFSKALVSAIMVTRNQECFLREAIEELMEQSVAARMEVIVVDAGSEQSEWAVIADLQRKHRNLIALRTVNDEGMNLALKVASGKYLTLLEPSDRMKHDAYEKLAAVLEENPDAMLAYGDTCSTATPHESFADHTSSGKVIWPDYTPRQLTHLHQVAPHPLWRRELHDSIGPFGTEGDAGIRWLLQQVAGRFRMIHLQEFTGLKLHTLQRRAERSLQPAAAAPSSKGPHPELQSDETPGPAQAPSPQASPQVPHPAPPQAPHPVTPDEAYRLLQGALKGPDLWQASSALKTHLGEFPDHAVAHNDFAAISYRMDDREKALRHYRIAVQLAPGESVYRKNLADLLFVEGCQVDEAITIYLDLLKETPEDVETLLNLGIISAQVGQPEEAETFLQRALEIEPWNQCARECLESLATCANGKQDLPAAAT